MFHFINVSNLFVFFIHAGKLQFSPIKTPIFSNLLQSKLQRSSNVAHFNPSAHLQLGCAGGCSIGPYGELNAVPIATPSGFIATICLH